MSDITNYNSTSSDAVSVDISIETISSESEIIDIVENWDTNPESDNINLSESEQLELIRQSIIDVSLQEDIENLDLVSIDEINNMSISELEDYKNHLINNSDIIPLDLIKIVNMQLFTIHNLISNHV